jgi:DNA-binding CsgD family transcriptional regulator
MAEPAPVVAAAPLLEREHELGALDALLGAGTDDVVRLAVIEGPAGIGKSRLIGALCERATESGARVLSARASELERAFPFGIVRQLFEPLMFDPADRERLFAGAAEAARPVFEHVTVDGGRGGDVSFSALHGLYWLTVNLTSERPLVLAVDDLSWADRPSLRFLAHLSRRLEGIDALLAMTLRTPEPGTDPAMIAEIADAPDAVRLQPRPLTRAAVEQLIEARLGSEPEPPFTDSCMTATGGNPLLLRQLLSSLESDRVVPEAAQASAVHEVGPRAVSRTVLRRLHHLPDEAALVAQAIAVLGDGAQLPLVAALAGLDERGAAEATAALARAEILRTEPPLGFVHQLVRDAVYHELPPAERDLRHAEAVRLLADANAPAEEVATHLLACPRRGEEWVVDLLSQAAASARGRGAADSAVAYLERALEEPPSPERHARVLRELGQAETLVSGPAAADHLRAAWEALGDPRERAEIASLLARTLVYTAAGKEAMAVVRRAVAELPPELADERQGLQAIEVMGIPLGVADDATVAALAELRIEGDGPGAKMLAAAAALARAITGSPADECVELATTALSGGVLVEHDSGFLPTAAATVLVMADREEALATWEGLRADAHRRGSMFGSLGIDLWAGATLLWHGDLVEAEETLQAGLDSAAAWGLLTSEGVYGPAFAFLGSVHVLRGDLERARQLLDPVTHDERRPRTSRLTLTSRVELLLAERRHEDALELATELGERFGPIVNPRWAPWRSLTARALDALGRTDEAIALASEELEHARRFGSAPVVGRSLRILATLERDRGVERLREAVELLEASTAKLDLAFALLALGSTLRRQRRPSDAREPLRRALELADRCAALPLAEQARAELNAAGGRPRRTALSGVEALTASERRVVDLAAEGATNKEIAQTLYVTPKTVEMHLSQAYRKLDIRSRRELSGALDQGP